MLHPNKNVIKKLHLIKQHAFKKLFVSAIVFESYG